MNEDLKEQVIKESLSHFSDIYSVYKDVKSRLQSPQTKKALGDIKVEGKSGEKVKASKASSAVPSSAEIFVQNIRKKIKRRKEKDYEGEYQKEIEPKLKKFAEKYETDFEEVKDFFFKTAEEWLNTLDEIGEKTRKRLLETYKPADLVNITKEDLKKIKGIGEKRAEKILATLPF